MNFRKTGRFFSFEITDSLILESDTDGSLYTGLLACKENGREFLIPVIEDIMIWISSELITDDYERNKLENILAEAANINFQNRLCDEYARNLRHNRESIQKSEIGFYEKKYRNRYDVIDNEFREYGDFLLSVKKEILDYLPDSFQKNKTVLEISGGDFYCMHYCYPAGIYHYTFIGTEISFWGLKCGKKFFPDSIMIQASLDDSMYFNKGISDLLFIKGVLHHALAKEDALIKLTPYIKKDGYLGIQEVILDQIKDSRLLRFLKSIAEPENKTSPLNESIDRKRFFEIYNGYFQTINCLEHSSIFKFAMNRFFGKFKTRSLLFSKFIHSTDKFINKIPVIRSQWITSTHLVSIAGKLKNDER